MGPVGAGSDALAVLDAAGEQTAHVYGVSLGGVVAQQIALQAPERVRSLVLGCTGMLTEDSPRLPWWVPRLLLIMPKGIRSLLLGRQDPYGPACPPERAEADRAVLAAERPVKRALLAQQDALRAYAISREQVATLDVPALVLHGTADTTVKHEHGVALAATLPDARFISFEGVGHNFAVGAGEPANEAVLEFLRDVDARRQELQPTSG